jgi:RNA polymerase sigma-70 factor (ECF subfamily)
VERDESDEALMVRYQRGDVRAFEVLLTRHRKPVFNFILRFVREPAVAEDLLQETFLRVIKGVDAYEKQAKFTTWLYTIAHNRIVDHWRARGLALVSLDDEDNPAGVAGRGDPRGIAPRAREAFGVAPLGGAGFDRRRPRARRGRDASHAAGAAGNRIAGHGLGAA